MTAIKKLRPVLRNYPLQEFLVLWYDWIYIPSATRFASLRCQIRALKYSNVTCTAFSSHSFRVQTRQFLGRGNFSCNFDNTAWIKLLHSIQNSNMILSLTVLLWNMWYTVESFVRWTITKQWWNAKFYKNAFFKILIKFQNMEHSNSRTFQGLSKTFKDLLCFQGLSRAWNFFPKF